MSFEDDIDLEDRKLEHIDIVLREDPVYKTSTWFEYVIPIHVSTPEASLDDIDLSIELFGRRFSYPILIDSMTGGGAGTEKINRGLAEVASKYNIPISCGSQKAILKDPSTLKTFRVIRDVDPNIYLIGNIGGQDLRHDPKGIAEKIVSSIDADALAIHLNPLQELIQPGGERDFRGVLDAIEEVCSSLDIPIIVKETGAGISMEVAKILEHIGVSAINVSGSGGTSWSAVETIRNVRRGDELMAEIGRLYWNWGIPTAASLMEVAASVDIPVFASGGIRNGLEVVKSLMLGASLAGMASPFLKHLSIGMDNLIQFMERLILEMKIAALLTGSRDIESLRKAPKVILGPLKEWAIQRGVWIGDI